MRDSKLYTVLNAKAANGVDNVIFAQDFKHTVFALDTLGTVTGTIKFVGSVQEDKPDFTAAQTVTNQWDYINIIDLEDGASIDGDTGIAYAAAAVDHRQLEANVNGLRWIGAIISGYTGGTFDVKARLFTND